MTITVSLIDALLAILIVLAIILLYQLIVLIKNLIPSARSMAKIMDDTSHITDAAKTGTEEAHRLVNNLSGSLSDVIGTLHNNKSTVAAVTNLTNALTNLAKLAKSKKK
ncbi:MAG: hypothetical protein QM215_03790 [Bacillota bacterium]|nr:hypothetical protein [Bacillota bacterium]NLV70960.1 hypothetical protein [Clostridiales bacterium]